MTALRTLFARVEASCHRDRSAQIIDTLRLATCLKCERKIECLVPGEERGEFYFHCYRIECPMAVRGAAA